MKMKYSRLFGVTSLQKFLVWPRGLGFWVVASMGLGFQFRRLVLRAVLHDGKGLH